MNEIEFYQVLSKKLKEIRKKRKLTQEQFSNQLNIGFYYYQRIEALNTRQTISINLLLQMCNNLNIELYELVKPTVGLK